MKPLRTRQALLAGAAALLLAIPAASQEAPESLLPPGFDDPNAPLPPPAKQDEPDRPATPRPQAPREQSRPVDPKLVEGLDPRLVERLDPRALENLTPEELRVLQSLELPKPIEMPDWAKRSPHMVGPLGPANWGLQPDAFGRSHGVFLSTLMRRLDAPLPSRWASMLLRRALLTRVPTPYGVSSVDWVAERAWLLLRMGEADAARMLVQAVDVEQFTPKMFAVAVQTALATADPAGLCPLVEPGREVSDEPVWPLADAMCAALGGEPSRAAALIDQARRSSGAGGIDLLLAEKVVGAGENTRRAVTIQWEPVDQLNSWRFGLASATGLSIPDRLMDTAGVHVRAWQARAPMLSIEERRAASDYAASLGVFSNASLVELYSLIADTTDPAEMRESIGGRLRLAYVGRNDEERMESLRQLWDDADAPVQQHARRILTASAAARIVPSEQFASDSYSLIASMLTAGLDRQAARWSKIVERMDATAADRSWAMLALASPRPTVDLSGGRITDFAGRDDSAGRMRSRLLVSALTGLGRISEGVGSDLGDDLGIDFTRRNRWTVMIDSAAQRRQTGTVLLLAGVGMQTADWRGVPPEYLYHIVRALRLSGLEYEARMIAAEAVSRL